MSLTYSNIQPQSAGSEGKAEFQITGDSSYPSGGYTVNASSVGLFRINRLNVQDSVINTVDIGTGQTLRTYIRPLVRYLTPFAANLQFYNGQYADNNIVQSFPNVAAGASTSSENVDAAAAPTNGTFVANYSNVAAGAWTVGALTNPDCLRNVCIVIRNNSGGALDLFQGSSTFTVTGTRNGTTITERITFTSTAGNKSVADTKFRYKYGAQPFDTVTNVTLTTNLPANGFSIGVGIGSKIGIENPLNSGVSSDVTKVILNAVDVTAGVTIDPAFSTRGVTFTTLAANDDVVIEYKGQGGQFAVGSDLSSLIVNSEIYGY